MSKYQVRKWLFTSSAVVGATVLVGGATRLTNSGLSIVEWRPVTGVMLPINERSWEAEFEKYKQYPEYIQHPIDMSHFKFIYLYEWGHRILGRLSGLTFVVPYIYFLKKGAIPKDIKPFLHLALGGFAFQGFLGWYMVKSGMDSKLLEEKKQATVSAYRLSAHLSTALGLFSVMMFCAFRLTPRAMLTYRGRFLVPAAGIATACVSTSIITGAAVAGLDAGMIYNDFPWMGEGIFPPLSEIAYLTPHWRNIFENPAAAQVVHKICACWSLASVIFLGCTMKGTSLNHFRHKLYLVCLGQISLGIAALMTNVNIYMGLAHQGTALGLLSCLMYVFACL